MKITPPQSSRSCSAITRSILPCAGGLTAMPVGNHSTRRQIPIQRQNWQRSGSGTATLLRFSSAGTARVAPPGQSGRVAETPLPGAAANRQQDGKHVNARNIANDFPVVCVGGSAGGLDAYTRLLRHLPATWALGSSSSIT